MPLMLSLADELGFKVNNFHHAAEAYKIADILAERNISASMGNDGWRREMTAYDGIESSASILETAGGLPIIHGDSRVGIQTLNQQAAKALNAGRRLGLELEDDEAIKWITRNPAIALGVEKYTGTLEIGKMGDVVLWNKDPLSIYAQADLVVIDGVVVHDRSGPTITSSDFDVGTEVEVLP